MTRDFFRHIVLCAVYDTTIYDEKSYEEVRWVKYIFSYHKAARILIYWPSLLGFLGVFYMKFIIFWCLYCYFSSCFGSI